MHSDSWVDVPNDQCPAFVQANRWACAQMDTFYDVARANERAAFQRVVELFEGRVPAWPAVRSLPSIDDAETRWLMESRIAEARSVTELLTSRDDLRLIGWALGIWQVNLQREADYLAYNRKALQKRIRRNAEQTELDRVQGLIDEGEEKIASLQPRVQWATAQVARRGQ